MRILQLKKLSLTIGQKRILSDIDLQLQPGRIHAIVGPNGAGKSTLASVIMGLSGFHEAKGDILFFTRSIRTLNVAARAKKGITMAWQEPARYSGLKIKDFIRAAAKKKTEKTIIDSLENVGLDAEEYMDRALDKTLSGGERKKVELASILAMQPKLALLDEPDSGIDVESLERIFKAIKLLKKTGTTVVLITHSLAVLKQAEHAYLMCHGQIVDEGGVPKISRYFENKCLSCLLKDPTLFGEDQK